MPERPKVGVGVFVIKEGKILMQKRQGAHGEGTWSFPGGHLEFNESWEKCAQRECQEELGITIKNIRYVATTNDIMPDDQKHYITIYMMSELASGEPHIKEPDKTEEWGWFKWEELPKPLFLPITNLHKQGFDFHKHCRAKLFQHYKGNCYKFIDEAKHSETHEEQVIYQALDNSPEFGKNTLWVRPKEMFYENIAINNQTIPRFKSITPLQINDVVYGFQEITDPLALEIINTAEMQRLKGINQYGVWNFFNPKYFTSRFDHCVGVYLLLRRLGASREEQIAGLIHDISHTAFSHVIDYVFDEGESQTVHERFKQQVINKSNIPTLLQKYGLTAEKIMNEEHFPLLEQELPNLCADRLDYFFRDSLMYGILKPAEAQIILRNLLVHNNEIVVNNPETAKQMADLFLQMGELFWSPPIQSGSYHVMAEILRQALRNNIITEEDFFLTDSQLLHKLQENNEISQQLKLISYENVIQSTSENYTYHTKAKARYINPKILDKSTIKTTTEIYPELQPVIEKFKAQREKGYYIKIIS